MLDIIVFTLAFIGLLAGVIVSSFTKEELKPGRKYFLLLEKALLLAIGFLLIFYSETFSVLIVFGFFFGLLVRKYYLYFGLALPLASETFLVLLGSLVFMFGLPHGTLLAERLKLKQVKKEILISAALFIIGLLVSYFFGYLALLMFCAGALLASAISLKKFWIFPIN